LVLTDHARQLRGFLQDSNFWRQLNEANGAQRLLHGLVVKGKCRALFDAQAVTCARAELVGEFQTQLAAKGLQDATVTDTSSGFCCCHRGCVCVNAYAIAIVTDRKAAIMVQAQNLLVLLEQDLEVCRVTSSVTANARIEHVRGHGFDVARGRLNWGWDMKQMFIVLPWLKSGMCTKESSSFRFCTHRSYLCIGCDYVQAKYLFHRIPQIPISKKKKTVDTCLTCTRWLVLNFRSFQEPRKFEPFFVSGLES